MASECLPSQGTLRFGAPPHVHDGRQRAPRQRCDCDKTSLEAARPTRACVEKPYCCHAADVSNGAVGAPHARCPSLEAAHSSSPHARRATRGCRGTQVQRMQSRWLRVERVAVRIMTVRVGCVMHILQVSGEAVASSHGTSLPFGSYRTRTVAKFAASAALARVANRLVASRRCRYQQPHLHGKVKRNIFLCLGSVLH